MPLWLSDEELSALIGLTDYQFRIYVQGIRKYMDSATKVVGIKRKISYQSLAEETYIEQIKGVNKTGTKSRDQVKRALKSLQRAGLLVAKSIVTKNEKSLILECVLAPQDEYAQNKAAPRPPHSAALKGAPLEYLENTIKIDTLDEYKNSGRPQGRLTENEKAAPPLISNISSSSSVELEKKIHSLSEYRSLLNDFGFRIEQLLHTKTTAMIKAWMSAEIGLDITKDAIEAVNANLGGLPGHPSYYLNPVLRAKENLKNAINAKHAASDVKHTKKKSRWVEYDDV